MTKHTLISRPSDLPPLVFLVDELYPQEAIGFTSDQKKIEHNRQHLGVENNLDIGIKTALMPRDGFAVIATQLGRYAVLLNFDGDEDGLMWFMDFRVALGYKREELKALAEQIFAGEFSSSILDGWIEIHQALAEGFNPAIHDWARLVKE